MSSSINVKTLNRAKDEICNRFNDIITFHRKGISKSISYNPMSRVYKLKYKVNKEVNVIESNDAGIIVSRYCSL